MVPFLTFGLISSIVSKQGFINYVLYPDCGLWFLWVLAFVHFLTYIGVNWAKRIGIFSYLIVNVALVWIPINYFGFGLIARYFTWFVVGYLCFKPLRLYLKNKLQDILMICFLIAWIVLTIFWNRNQQGPFSATILNKIYTVYVVPFFGIFAIFGVTYKIWSRKKKGLKIVSYFGMHTLEIYAIQFYCIRPFTGNVILDSIISFILALIIPLAISKGVAYIPFLNFVFFGKNVKKIMKLDQI